MNGQVAAPAGTDMQGGYFSFLEAPRLHGVIVIPVPPVRRHDGHATLLHTFIVLPRASKMESTVDAGCQ